MADREIDARGMNCPLPVLRAKEALAGMGDGVLTVVVDNEDSSNNVAWAARKAGYESAIERRGDDWAVRIHVEGSHDQAAGEMPVTCATERGVVVFAATDRVGRGDDELGGILMESFLHSLTQLDRPPQALVLMNSGVRLAIEGAEAVESLRALASANVDVLVCGTCLDFFGLRDKLAVGRVSNMYEIVETLSRGASVLAV
jgi:selenium metabolism protein YedF